jgi:hypothetical protein
LHRGTSDAADERIAEEAFYTVGLLGVLRSTAMTRGVL